MGRVPFIITIFGLKAVLQEKRVVNFQLNFKYMIFILQEISSNLGLLIISAYLEGVFETCLMILFSIVIIILFCLISV